LSPDEIKEKTMTLQDIQQELEAKTEQWFELSMKMEA
jgi:ATP-binding cassette subfamily F protein uup